MLAVVIYRSHLTLTHVVPLPPVHLCICCIYQSSEAIRFQMHSSDYVDSPIWKTISLAVYICFCYVYQCGRTN